MRNFIACVAAIALLTAIHSSAHAASSDGRVTRIVREVNLLPTGSKARAAALDDQVREGVGVRTGDKARSELTFSDLTITRLGANTIFSFNKAGRNVQLESGSLLLRVPQNSGGASVRGKAVTVAVTGTTFILEGNRSGRANLMVLEGSARLTLVRNRSQSREVRAGQKLEVPAGATTLGQPEDFDIDRAMKTHPLIAGFAPLPSRDLIAAAARDRRRGGPGGETVYQGQPVSGGRPPVMSVGLPFPGMGVPPFGGGARNPGSSQPPSRGGGNQPGGSGRAPGTTTGLGGITNVGPATSGGRANQPGTILRRPPVRRPAPTPGSIPTPIR